jgi:hypothetical protein
MHPRHQQWETEVTSTTSTWTPSVMSIGLPHLLQP